MPQPDGLCERLRNCSDAEKQKVAMSSELALTDAQSMLGNGVSGDDDMIPVGHVTRSLETRVGVGEGEGTPPGSPLRIDPAEKAVDAATPNKGATASKVKKKSLTTPAQTSR